MIGREWMDWLRIGHGAFNFTMALTFLYQGLLGLRIRRERMAEGAKELQTIMRHRKLGPLLVFFGVAGYFSGAFLIYIDEGHFYEYPIHNFVGSMLVLLLVVTFFISRRIKGLVSPWRTSHALLGLAILACYLLQLFLGLNILF